MHYHQFTITAPPRYQQTVIQEVMRIGALGVIEEGRDITAFFPDASPREQIASRLAVMRTLLRCSDPGAVIAISSRTIASTDWNASWKKTFTPLPVGERFVILPPWETPPPGRIPLIIDPGMAFGTGHHETTRSCLLLMERYAEAVKKDRFLDVGTGTGLLAIAAEKLGFAVVEGIDTDGEAIRSAERNLALNRTVAVALYEGEIGSRTGNYDLIAANIISGTLVNLAPAIAARIRESGRVILSGILRGQEDEVIRAMDMSGLTCDDRLIDGKWISLCCLRPAEVHRTSSLPSVIR